MKRGGFFPGISIFATLLISSTLYCADIPVSQATDECLGCHESIHAGIVQDWKNSRHASTTVRQALEKKGLALKVSAKNIPENLLDTAVGCAECHTMRSKSHKDTFNHAEYDVHVVVTPDDCATCHEVEAKQYSENIMSHALKNLDGNPLYQDLQKHTIGTPTVTEGQLVFEPSNPETQAESCYYCHGTRLRVTGEQTRDTLVGEMQFPVIEGWPNQGVGRANPDDSVGACTPCHTRHGFSIEMARKPYTCKECHVGPDVPAFKVYMSSKHGNIFSTHEKEWNFSPVPWTVGKDFTAPTCASCHISLLVNTDGMVVAERTHRMNDRLPWRIFGLIYAHEHPKSPDTTIIRNKDGQPLPTDLSGGRASKFLIDSDEMKKRKESMQGVCLNCHDTAWVNGHWSRFENTIDETNEKILTATGIMLKIWEEGFAEGPDRGKSPWDESIEKTWSDAWLFYGNTIRFASAMAGGGDYGVYADGRYHLTKRILSLKDWLETRRKISLLSKPPVSETKTTSPLPQTK